jgi:EpsI family protein
MSEILYRWLLKLYPRRFREAYGDAMLQLFRDRLRAENTSRVRVWPGRVRVWIDTLRDLIVSVPREYRRDLPEAAWATALLLILIALSVPIWYASQARRLHPASRVAFAAFPGFAAFPRILGDWRNSADLPVDADVREILGADDLLSRFYISDSDMDRAHLFLARFTRTSLRRPDPRIPGERSSWRPAEPPGTISISVPGQSMRVAANRWVMTNGVERSVVLYWYQSRNRAIASAFWAKAFSAIGPERGNIELVRVVVPVHGAGPEFATSSAVRFVQAVFPEILKQI